ncbi:hypothetical protein HY442_01030 [Candidatus Parcubacteria bacterium]|nr:hypothetical protein [Candidatus Parcubacteria bacterium]MBI4385651.1 hypothetical protein [Candidatus Parcubacteria bacterium]
MAETFSVRFSVGPKGLIGRPEGRKFCVPERGFDPVVGDSYEVEVARDTAPGERRGVLIVRLVKNQSEELRQRKVREQELTEIFRAAGIEKFPAECLGSTVAAWPLPAQAEIAKLVLGAEQEAEANWRRGWCWRANNGATALNRHRWLEVAARAGRKARVERWNGERLFPTGERQAGSDGELLPLVAVEGCHECKKSCEGEVSFPDAENNPSGWFYHQEGFPIHHGCRAAYAKGYAAARSMAERD